MKKKLNFTDYALIAVGITTILFIIAMIITFWQFQMVPDVLINNFFRAIFGEISIAGILTCNKRKYGYTNNDYTDNIDDDDEQYYERSE